LINKLSSTTKKFLSFPFCNKDFKPFLKRVFFCVYTNQFKKPLNKKDGFYKSLISRCFAEGKTPALLLPSPRRPAGGAGYRY